MKYADEMGSGAMHAKLHKDWFRPSKVIGGGGGDRISQL
jgi:hypothetical protein